MVQLSKIQINTNYHIYYHLYNRIVKLITIATSYIHIIAILTIV